jgi:hypothetical protein
MHSVETDPKPLEVFQGVGRLIIEGRIPGLTTRGFGEGPHCLHPFQSNAKHHTCTPHNILVSLVAVVKIDINIAVFTRYMDMSRARLN